MRPDTNHNNHNDSSSDSHHFANSAVADVTVSCFMRVCVGLLLIVGLGLGLAMPTALAQTSTEEAAKTASTAAQGSSDAKANEPDSLLEYVQEQIQQLGDESSEQANAEDSDGSNERSENNQQDDGGSDSASESEDDNLEEQAGVMLSDSELAGEYNESYYVLNRLNAGLPPLSQDPNLETPLATLEFFQSAVAQERYDLASYALNMNAIPSDEQTSQGQALVKKLDYLLSEKGLYVFDNLPDRSDGLVEPLVGSNSSIQGIPRRTIQLGVVDYRSRSIPMSVERVRVGDDAPIWVFSAATVENINMLYDQHKPAQFEQFFPEWLKARLFGIAIWEYVALMLFYWVTFLLGWLISKGVEKSIDLLVKHDKLGDDEDTRGNSITQLIESIIVPLTSTISFALVFTLVSGGFPFIDPIASSTRPLVWVGLVFVTMWLGIRILNFFAQRYQDLKIDSLDEKRLDKQRQRRTYLSIFRRIFIFVMVLVGIWVSLSAFTDIEGLGTTLLTSAGIAGAIIGIAAQPTLGNIIAGMQVAITQPVRIGDTVIVEGAWSTVEDLRYTYAVIKTWDERRLIVPMKHFVTEIIENWSHTNAHQCGAVYLYVDYGADVEQIRQTFIAMVKAHELWKEGEEPEMLVTKVDENTITLRGQMAADGPNEAWAMECAVREKMLKYLATEQGDYLPTDRFSLRSDPVDSLKSKKTKNKE